MRPIDRDLHGSRRLVLAGDCRCAAADFKYPPIDGRVNQSLVSIRRRQRAMSTAFSARPPGGCRTGPRPRPRGLRQWGGNAASHVGRVFASGAHAASLRFTAELPPDGRRTDAGGGTAANRARRRQAVMPPSAGRSPLRPSRLGAPRASLAGRHRPASCQAADRAANRPGTAEAGSSRSVPGHPAGIRRSLRFAWPPPAEEASAAGQGRRGHRGRLPWLERERSGGCLSIFHGSEICPRRIAAVGDQGLLVLHLCFRMGAGAR